MRTRSWLAAGSAVVALLLAYAPSASAQSSIGSRIVLDFGVGIDPSINGNINSGAIGTLQGQSTAILPNTYGDVYGTGVQFRFGGGYVLDEYSELRGVFTYQSADADLVRLGDIGASSLYGQYSDYKSLGLDFGYRRYFQIRVEGLRVYGEATAGIAAIDRINLLLAAPQSNVVFNNTDFYDGTSAFTMGVNGGVLFRIAEHVDLNAQIGLRRVSGMSEVDNLAGTGLEDINNDTSRLTFPIVVGARIRFK